MFSAKNLDNDNLLGLSPTKKIKENDETNNKNFQYDEGNDIDIKNNEDLDPIKVTSAVMDNLNCNYSPPKEIKINNNNNIALSIEEDSEFVNDNNKNISSPKGIEQPLDNNTTANEETSVTHLDMIKRCEVYSSPSQSSISCSSNKSFNSKQKTTNDNNKDADIIDKNQNIELRFLVRRREAGALIGKKGSNIKRLRDTFKSSAFSIPDTGNGPERVVCIVTNENSLDSILNDLTELMKEKSPENDEQIEIKLLIHSSHAGSLIGIGGQSIKKLRNDSKAAIKIYEMCCPLSNERVCAIKAKPPVVVNTIKLIQNIFYENPIKGTIKPYDALHFDLNLVDKYGGYLPDEATSSIDLIGQHNHHYQNNHHNPYNEIQNHHHAYHPLAFNHRHHHHHHRQHFQNVALAAATAYQTTKQHFPLWRPTGSETFHEACPPIDMQIDDNQIYQHESNIMPHLAALQTNATSPPPPQTKIDSNLKSSPANQEPELASDINKNNNNNQKSFGIQNNVDNNDSENSTNKDCKHTTNNDQPINNNNKPSPHGSGTISNNSTTRQTNRYHPYNQQNNKLSSQSYNSANINYYQANNNSLYRNLNMPMRGRFHHVIAPHNNQFNPIRHLNSYFTTSLNNHFNVDNYNYQQQHQRIQQQQQQQQQYFPRLPTTNFPQANLIDRCHRHHNATSRSCVCMFLPNIIPDSLPSSDNNITTNNIIAGANGALNQLIQQQQQQQHPPPFVQLPCKNYNYPQVQLSRNFRANNETFKKK